MLFYVLCKLFFFNYSGASCEELVRLTGNEFQFKFSRMPIRDAEKLRAGIEQLRQCFALASETEPKQMPDLRAYLTEQGVDSVIMRRLEGNYNDLLNYTIASGSAKNLTVV